MFEKQESPTRLRTRNKIINESKKLFDKQGILNTQIKQIAEVTGITRVTVYDHFPKKVDIVNAIMHDYFEELYVFQMDYSECENGFEKLSKLFHTLFDIYFKKENIMRFLTYYYLAYPKQTELEKALFTDIEKTIQTSRFNETYVEGFKDGSIINENPNVISNIIIQHIIGIAMRYSLRSDAFFGSDKRPTIKQLQKSLDMLLLFYKQK